MNGEIGALYHEGQQIGGLLNWADTSAEAYWLFSDPIPSYHAKLYGEEKGKLVLRWEGTLSGNLPPCDIDKLIRYAVTFSVDR